LQVGTRYLLEGCVPARECAAVDLRGFQTFHLPAATHQPYAGLTTPPPAADGGGVMLKVSYRNGSQRVPLALVTGDSWKEPGRQLGLGSSIWRTFTRSPVPRLRACRRATSSTPTGYFR